MTSVVVSAGLELWTGDARDVLPRLPAGSVAAVVTSPPYADARPDVVGPPLDSFAEWFEPMLSELRRVLAPSGSLMLNLGRRFRGGEEHPFHEDTLARARALGWRRIDTLIWRKPNANPIHGKAFSDNHECVYVLGGPATVFNTDAVRRPHAESTKRRFDRNWTNHIGVKNGNRPRLHTRPAPNPLGARPMSVFDCYVGSEKGNPHPSPIPGPLARHLVLLASFPGAVVLDPFCGSGNVLREALLTGRRAVGIDLDERWIHLTAERCAVARLEVSA